MGEVSLSLEIVSCDASDFFFCTTGVWGTGLYRGAAMGAVFPPCEIVLLQAGKSCSPVCGCGPRSYL